MKIDNAIPSINWPLHVHSDSIRSALIDSISHKDYFYKSKTIYYCSWGHTKDVFWFINCDAILYWGEVGKCACAVDTIFHDQVKHDAVNST